MPSYPGMTFTFPTNVWRPYMPGVPPKTDSTPTSQLQPPVIPTVKNEPFNTPRVAPPTPPEDTLPIRENTSLFPTEDEAIWRVGQTPSCLPSLHSTVQLVKEHPFNILQRRVDSVLDVNRAMLDQASSRLDMSLDEDDMADDEETANTELLQAASVMKQRLAASMTLRHRELDDLREEYLLRNAEWKRYCSELDRVQSLHVSQDALTHVARLAKRGDGTGPRSETELEHVLVTLSGEDIFEPSQLYQRNVATIPNMISVQPSGAAMALVDLDEENGFVADPRDFYASELQPYVGDWTDDEIEAFKSRFAEQPKQFGFISQAPEIAAKGRTAEQCVVFYYMSKKHRINFRQVLSKYGMRRRRNVASNKGGALLADIQKTDKPVRYKPEREQLPSPAPQSPPPAQPVSQPAPQRPHPMHPPHAPHFTFLPPGAHIPPGAFLFQPLPQGMSRVPTPSSTSATNLSGSHPSASKATPKNPAPVQKPTVKASSTITSVKLSTVPPPGAKSSPAVVAVMKSTPSGPSNPETSKLAPQKSIAAKSPPVKAEPTKAVVPPVSTDQALATASPPLIPAKRGATEDSSPAPASEIAAAPALNPGGRSMRPRRSINFAEPDSDVELEELDGQPPVKRTKRSKPSEKTFHGTAKTKGTRKTAAATVGALDNQ